MGLGFRLCVNGSSPFHSSFNSNSSSKLLPSLPGKEASFNSARLSFLSITSEESESFCRDTKLFTCLSSSPQIIENGPSQIEEMKTNSGKITHNSLSSVIDGFQEPTVADKFVSDSALKACMTSHFTLLMQNVRDLEESFVDSDVLKLEKDILLHLGRIGVLKLFNSCLPSILENSNVMDLFGIPAVESIDDHNVSSILDLHMGKTIVGSKRRGVRKPRKRLMRMSDKVSSQSLPSESVLQVLHHPTVLSLKRASNSKSRRLALAKNEAEMSTGIKVLANLERIRTTLEEDSGQVASLSCWAEAAGVDEKMLQQQLHFGWYCRDELVRSTKSLVIYLARNYRGLGIALEDLLQAGYHGVLQGAERFDRTRGCRFSTYVHYWIRKSMLKLVAQHSRGIKIPCTLSKAMNQIQRTRKSMNNSQKKSLDDCEIAKLTGLSLARIGSASQCLRVVGSLDQKTGDCFTGKYIELIPDMSISSPEESVMRQHMRNDIHDLLRSLDSRERQVLVLRYGLKNCQPKSLDEIGKLFHVSKEWIRKIERKALTKLRHEETRKNLSHYTKL